MTLLQIPFFLLLSSLLAPDPGAGAGPLHSGPQSPAAIVDGAFGEPRASCEIPVRWSLGDIDDRFGLTRDEAARAIRLAGLLWSEAAEHPLLFQEAEEGMPIRFIFDERQASMLERRERAAELERIEAGVAEAEAELESSRTELARLRVAHERRSMDLQERQERHAVVVDQWARRGGAPTGEFQRLREIEEQLEEDRVEVNRQAEELNRLVGEVNSRTDQLNQAITELNRARSAFQADFPGGTVQSGEYVETARTLGPVVFSREREIRIYHFEDWDHLLLVLAHELGHALGLGHAPVEGALMAEDAGTRPPEGRPEIHLSDLQQLRARCPEL